VHFQPDHRLKARMRGDGRLRSGSHVKLQIL